MTDLNLRIKLLILVVMVDCSKQFVVKETKLNVVS